jgi:acyl-coenzyme A thioesterase PaaI-like protein
LLALWRRLAPLPGGKTLFSWIVGRTVPYSGSVRPRVLDLEPGYARIGLSDRRAVRNHLASIHAIALANIAELTSGLAMTTALQPHARGILTRISIEYLKKARGELIAEARCDVPEITDDVEHEFISSVRDSAGDVVARATARWRLGPRRSS